MRKLWGWCRRHDGALYLVALPFGLAVFLLPSKAPITLACIAVYVVLFAASVTAAEANERAWRRSRAPRPAAPAGAPRG